MLRIAFPLVAAVWAGTATAETAALLIGTEDYDRVNDVRRADDIAGAASALTRAGIRVVSRRDTDLEDIQQALGEFGQMIDGSDRLLVALGGRFLHSATETYFLASDSQPGPLASISGTALPLSTVTAWLAAKPGEAVLILATDDLDAEFGAFLAAGVGDIDLPQGVTLLAGEPRRVASFIEDQLARPGADLIAEARRDGLSVSGFAAAGQVFVEVAEDEPEPEQNQTGVVDRLADIRAWRDADRENTVEAYQSYLDAFPNGEFRRMAENRIQALDETPEARAERAEQALDLDRDQRREIQRDLSLLDYNTRGIDGIFGRGTRAAISSWQRAQGFDATGYLTRDQITRLDAQAERRAAELEEEAERRRAQ